MGCGASVQGGGDGGGAAAPAVRERKGGKYVDVQALEAVLLGAVPPIRLVKASFLLAKAKEQVGMRQTLESDEPMAFGDEEMLQRCLGEVWKAAGAEDMSLCMYPAIVAISHFWATKEHPDPKGERLSMLIPALRWYMANRAAKDLDPDFLLFWDYYSLFQEQRTEQQQALYLKAVERMDLLYAHRGIMVWMLGDVSGVKGWMDSKMGEYFERGWTTFERVVASHGKGKCHFLDIGKFAVRDELVIPSVAAFLALSRADLARLADPTGPKGEHYADEGVLATLVKDNREAPITPSDFAVLLQQKKFAVDADAAVVAKLQKAVADAVLGELEDGMYSNQQWLPHQLGWMGSALQLCSKLRTLSLDNCAMTSDGLEALARALPRGPGVAVESLSLSDNNLADAHGWAALGEALQGGGLRKLRSLELRESGLVSSGLEALAGALQAEAAPALESLLLCDNELHGEQGWAALGLALQRGAMPKLRAPDWKQCGLSGAGLAAWAGALGRDSACALETLALSFNDAQQVQGWTALGKALERGAFPKLRFLYLEWCGMTGDGLEALAAALSEDAAGALETLDLVGNELDGAQGWAALTEAVRRRALPRLRKLFTGGLIDEERKTALRAAGAHPELHIT